MNTKAMRPVLVLFATIVALLVGLFAMPVAASSQPVPDQVIPWPGDEANHASYWEGWLGDGWTCEKVDQEGPFTTDHFYGAVITKGGLWNNVFYNVPSGTDFSDVIRVDQPAAGISHYFVCNEDNEATPTPKPTATPTPAPSDTPTPKPTKPPKPTATPTVPPTDTLDQTSSTGSSSGGLYAVLAVIAGIVLLTTMLTPATARIKKRKQL